MRLKFIFILACCLLTSAYVVRAECKPAVKGPAEAAIKITTEQFWKAIADKRGKPADEKYNGKLVEITGKVLAVRGSRFMGVEGDFVDVALYADAETENAFEQISCIAKDARIYLKVGEKGSATFRGRVGNRKGIEFPVIDDCELVSFKGELPLQLTLNDFVAAIKSDPKKAADKFNGKQCVIRTTVKSKVEDGIMITFGSGDDEVEASVAHDVVISHVKAGDSVELLCNPWIVVRKPTKDPLGAIGIVNLIPPTQK